jgi:LmbE family N-acetylglucosaminyl deacetylase
VTRTDVVAVFAHPDDESVLAGGTLAACAAAGLSTGVVSMTRGELGGSGAVREAELREAGRALGVDWTECMGYPDAELPWVEDAEAIASLSERLQRSRPEAVITFGGEGLYWHPDHVAVHRLVTAASAGLDARLYFATLPLGRMRALADAMADRGLELDVWGLDPDAFGAAPGTIAIALDVRPFLEAKLAALRSHVTQLGRHGSLAGLPSDLAEEFLGTEYFGAGPDEASWLSATVASAVRS